MIYNLHHPLKISWRLHTGGLCEGEAQAARSDGRGEKWPYENQLFKVCLESKDLGAESTRESRGPTSGVFRIALDRRPRGFEHRQCRAACGIKFVNERRRVALEKKRRAPPSLGAGGPPGARHQRQRMSSSTRRRNMQRQRGSCIGWRGKVAQSRARACRRDAGSSPRRTIRVHRRPSERDDMRWPDGSTSDIINLSRAKDPAAIIAERGPPERNRRLFHSKIEPVENTPAATN
jgi:hypothetical protein